VIVVGGADENAIFLQSCEEFDPSREQWLRMADMQHNRSGHAVVASHGKSSSSILGLIPSKGRKKVKKHFRLRDSWLEALSNAQQ